MTRAAAPADLTAAYAALGVAPTDDFDTIRAAWRRLVRTHHPDVAGPGSTPRLAAINDAFDTLRHHRTLTAGEARARAAEVLREDGFSPTVLHRNLGSRPADRLERR